MSQIEIDMVELAKAKKKVWVKPTAQKKGHYREQEVGQKGDQKIVLAIKRSQSEGDTLKEKMNAMIDKYYHGEEISPEHKKKIDAVENQMKGAYAERDGLRKKYREMTTR